MRKLNPVEQCLEARSRLMKAMQSLERFNMDCFTETEVEFRVETVGNLLQIVINDIITMEKMWKEEV
jgi:hypothetical protein